MLRSGKTVDNVRSNMISEFKEGQQGQQASSELWQADIVEDVAFAYLQQVQSLVETARQMDSVFMKRSKGGAATTTATNKSTLSDSEKIAMQMIFDINAFEQEIMNVGIENPSTIKSFVTLHDQIDEMKQLFQNL